MKRYEHNCHLCKREWLGRCLGITNYGKDISINDTAICNEYIYGGSKELLEKINEYNKKHLPTREIKFRVWDSNKKEMFNVNSINFNNYEVNLQDKQVGPWYSNKNDKIHIMQYIGFDDKNNTSIYEGDILIITCYSYEDIESELTGEIIYNNRLACFGLISENEFYTLSDQQGTFKTEYEIIGNIYKNPEILMG